MNVTIKDRRTGQIKRETVMTLVINSCITSKYDTHYLIINSLVTKMTVNS